MLRYKAIAVAGVDGTGKSTLVQHIRELFEPNDNQIVVQYMGMNKYETKYAKKYYYREKKSFIGWFAIFGEIRHRIYKHNKKAKVVIFDRYVDEYYLDQLRRNRSIKNMLIQVLYKIYFVFILPRPDFYFYLKCDAGISLSRKDDITTNEEKLRFLELKRIMDDYYCNKNSIKVIDTSEKSFDDILCIVMNEIYRDDEIYGFLRNRGFFELDKLVINAERDLR